MCSVVGCDSWRRSAQCFNLPEDPEMRSQWVQFVASDDEQLYKESVWSGMAICQEHFLEECFEKTLDSIKVQLKPCAVPTVRIKSEEVDRLVDSLQRADPLKTEDDVGYCETAYKEETELEGNIGIQEKLLTNENCVSQFFPHKCPSCSGKLLTEKVTVGTVITLNQQCLQCEYRNGFTRQICASTTENQSSTPSTEVTIEPHQTNTFNNSETFAFYKEESGVPIEEERCCTVGVTPGEDKFSIKKPVVDKEEDTEVIERSSPNQEEVGGCDDDLFPLKKPAPTSNTDTEEDVTSEEEGSGHVNSDEDWFPIKKPARTKENIEKDFDKGTEEDTTERPNYVDMPTPVRRSTKQLCNECGYFCPVDRAHICEHKLKPYACNTCGKRCFTKISLKLHCLIHGNSKIHTCKYCFAPFKTKLEKMNHQQTHDDSPYPFQCPACPARFICFIERRNHMRAHPEPKQYKCEQCGITFTKRHVLLRHMVVHTGDKPFKCSVCERGFNQPGHLKSHMRLHSGERPYKCQHCDKTFNHNVSLKSHIQCYHPNKTDDACDSNDTQSDPCEDNVEKQQDTEEVGDRKKVVLPKTKKRLTGRPKGRPKLNRGDKSYSKRKKKGKSQMKKQHSDKESEELTDSNSSFDMDKEEKQKESKTRKCTSKLKTYFDPDYIPDRKGKRERPKRSLRKGRGKAKL